MREYGFDVPAMTTVRVNAESQDDALNALGEMQMLSWDLQHGDVVITELSLISDSASLFEMDGKSLDTNADGVYLSGVEVAQLRQLIAEIRAAANGDSNDAEIDASGALATYVMELIGDE